jgi:hypothetical protein
MLYFIQHNKTSDSEIIEKGKLPVKAGHKATGSRFFPGKSRDSQLPIILKD